MKNAFIVESHIGEHHSVDDRFNADVFSFTFAPNMYAEPLFTKNFSYLMPNNIKPVRVNGILDVTGNIQASLLNYDKIFIGMDLDIEGNAMSLILRDHLLFLGKSEDDIIRIPLTYNGFVAVSNFWDSETIEEYLLSRKEEIEFVQYSKKVNGSIGVGRRTALLYNELINPPESVKNLNSNGTSSITYIFKKKIKEK